MEHYVKTRRKAPSLQEETPVQSRMVNLRELNPEITPDRLERALVSVFARSFRARPVWLDEQLLDAASLERLTASFAQPEWTYPAQENYDFDVSRAFPLGQRDHSAAPGGRRDSQGENLLRRHGSGAVLPY